MKSGHCSDCLQPRVQHTESNRLEDSDILPHLLTSNSFLLHDWAAWPNTLLPWTAAFCAWSTSYRVLHQAVKQLTCGGNLGTWRLRWWGSVHMGKWSFIAGLQNIHERTLWFQPLTVFVFLQAGVPCGCTWHAAAITCVHDFCKYTCVHTCCMYTYILFLCQLRLFQYIPYVCCWANNTKSNARMPVSPFTPGIQATCRWQGSKYLDQLTQTDTHHKCWRHAATWQVQSRIMWSCMDRQPSSVVTLKQVFLKMINYFQLTSSLCDENEVALTCLQCTLMYISVMCVPSHSNVMCWFLNTRIDFHSVVDGRECSEEQRVLGEQLVDACRVFFKQVCMV